MSAPIDNEPQLCFLCYLLLNRFIFKAQHRNILVKPIEHQSIPLLHPAICEVQQPPPRRNIFRDLSCSLVAILPAFSAVSCRGDLRQIVCDVRNGSSPLSTNSASHGEAHSDFGGGAPPPYHKFGRAELPLCRLYNRTKRSHPGGLKCYGTNRRNPRVQHRNIPLKPIDHQSIPLLHPAKCEVQQPTSQLNEPPNGKPATPASGPSAFVNFVTFCSSLAFAIFRVLLRQSSPLLFWPGSPVPFAAAPLWLR
jgi:hypothetical protein